MMTSGKLVGQGANAFYRDREYILTILLGFSVAYGVLGGGLGLFYPNTWGKMDFNLFYRVGGLAWDGIDPYSARQGGSFAYPPAWIVICALLPALSL